jgi:hypothetical protein
LSKLNYGLLHGDSYISVTCKFLLRLCAVAAGLVLGLGCLFASFAREFPQIVISYGLLLGLGLGMRE